MRSLDSRSSSSARFLLGDVCIKIPRPHLHQGASRQSKPASRIRRELVLASRTDRLIQILDGFFGECITLGNVSSLHQSFHQIPTAVAIMRKSVVGVGDAAVDPEEDDMTVSISIVLRKRSSVCTFSSTRLRSSIGRRALAGALPPLGTPPRECNQRSSFFRAILNSKSVALDGVARADAIRVPDVRGGSPLAIERPLLTSFGRQRSP